VTHSGEIGVFVLTTRNVGINAEHIRASVAWEEIPEHHFCKRELDVPVAVAKPKDLRILLLAARSTLSGYVGAVAVEDGAASLTLLKEPAWTFVLRRALGGVRMKPGRPQLSCFWLA
jgi:hypothetical protein